MFNKVVMFLLLAFSCHIGFECTKTEPAAEQESCLMGGQIDVVITDEDDDSEEGIYLVGFTLEEQEEQM